MSEQHETVAVLSPEQARRRRRRSLALALILAAFALLFYVMAIAHGPEIMNRPI